MMNQSTMTQRRDARIGNLPIPDGQERLATQQERDDVGRWMEARTVGVIRVAQPRRETGDQVNRFLLCALVNQSSRHIKASAARIGETLPMSKIVRGVLRAYRLAAEDKSGPFDGSTFDVTGLKQLNEKVLTDEIARFSVDRVKTSRARVARAERLGDDAKTKVERTELERAIELRDRFTNSASNDSMLLIHRAKL